MTPADLIRTARELREGEDLDGILKIASRIDRIPADEYRKAGFVTKKLAILPGYTTGFLAKALRVQLLPYRILLEVMEGDFGTFARDALTPDETIARFQPDLAWMCTGTDHVGFDNLNVDAEIARWSNLLSSCAKTYGCAVIANTFVVPSDRIFGNLATRLPTSRTNFIRRLNSGLVERAPSQVHFCDVDFLASSIGLGRFRSESLYHSSKIPCALEHVPAWAKNIAAIVAAIYGASKKCLVLDLDNTLWGGVVGDDGAAGLTIGPGTQDGEAFVAFQKYIRALKDRGVILAVCSKNDEPRAQEPFLTRDDMVLKLDDFSCFVANWERKDQNIRAIAKAINIGLDSLVFLDDNPVERELVRTSIPEVTVLELPPDPSDFLHALASSGWFETVNVTAEDLARTKQYKANLEREQLEQNATSYDDYLASLDMRAVIAEFDDLNLGRIVQLINKTNQFNVTTKRYAERDVREMMKNGAITRYMKLSDRFGDNGLIALAIGLVEGAELTIDTLLMSCRVLKRNAEIALALSLFEEARKRGIRTVKASYLPTEKNGLVKDLFPTLGFSLVREEPNGATHWSLDLTSEKLTPLVEKARFIAVASASDG